MKREEELTVSPTWKFEVKHGQDGEENYAWVLKGREMVATMRTYLAREICQAMNAALLPTPNPEPVGWRWRYRDGGVWYYTDTTPEEGSFDVLPHEPLYAHPPGVARQVHHSKPVVSQNTQIVEDKATEGGAHEKVLAEENRRLREALEPFAEHADEYSDETADDCSDWPTFEVGDFRRARAALTAKQTDGREGA